MEVIMETIGLLAGIGTLPVEFIEAVRPQGYRVVCIAVTPGVDARLAAIADAYYDISAFKLDKVIKTLVKEKFASWIVNGRAVVARGRHRSGRGHVETHL